MTSEPHSNSSRPASGAVPPPPHSPPENRDQEATALAGWIKDFIFESTGPGRTGPTDLDASFNRLALPVFEWQRQQNPIYEAACRRTGDNALDHWSRIPALPIRAFKDYAVTSLPEQDRTQVFHSSGTSGRKPSCHYHHSESLALYQASLLPWFEHHVGPLTKTPQLLILTPSPEQAPHSSLVHMMSVVQQHWQASHADASIRYFGGTGNTGHGSDWIVPIEPLQEKLEGISLSDRPVTLLGTAFNLLEFMDACRDQGLRFQLPPGSCLMETGGYKGRTRALSRQDLVTMIGETLAIPATHVVSEYGMSELSSQAYDGAVPRGRQSSQPAHRAFQFPPWVRTRIVSPETGRPVAIGETGLLEVIDLANLWSVAAIQTEDLARQEQEGFTLVGRASQAEARGCSLQSIDAG